MVFDLQRCRGMTRRVTLAAVEGDTDGQRGDRVSPHESVMEPLHESVRDPPATITTRSDTGVDEPGTEHGVRLPLPSPETFAGNALVRRLEQIKAGAQDDKGQEAQDTSA